MKSVRHLDFRRLGPLAAAWLGVAAIFLAPAAALAAQVTIISPSNKDGIKYTQGAASATAVCPIASVIGDGNGNFTFTCTGALPPNEAGTLSLDTTGMATGIPVGSGSTAFKVARTGGVTGAVTGTLSVTSPALPNTCDLSATTVSFADGSAVPSPQTVTLSAASAPEGSTCVVTLAPGTGGASPGSPLTLSMPVTAQSPGTLALSLSSTATSMPVTSGSTTFAVTRSNGNSGAATATLGVTGGCSLSTPSVTFAAGSSTPSVPTVTVSAGSATGGASCTITLSAAGAALGSPSSHIISIAADTTPPPPPPPPTGCTSNATRTVAWAGIQQFQDLRAGETLAISFDPAKYPLASRTTYRFDIVEGGSMSLGADVQFTVSDCPGDFAASTRLGAACMKHTAALGDGIDFRVGTIVTRNPVCYLPAGTGTMYFNVRPVLRPTPNPPDAAGTTSCPIGAGCRFSINLSR